VEESRMQRRPVSSATAEHYTWGNNCDGWHLVKEQKLSVIEEQMPPGTAEVLHYHGRSQLFFFVLSGEAVMEIDGQQACLTVRDGIRVPPTVRHQIRNVSTKPVRFLAISQPSSHGDRVVVEELHVHQ
jgi:mannose-6-phosphate isomerase-like protein (cupin superfamily)